VLGAGEHRRSLATLDHDPLGKLAPDTRDRLQAPRVPRGDRRRERRRRHAREHRERDAGPEALYPAEQVEELALDRRREAEQLDRVLAHLGVNEQPHARLLGERAREARDHAPSRARASARASGACWRWQRASASASAASAGGGCARPSRAATPRATVSLSARPCPTAASFTSAGAYSSSATPLAATAASTAPRASPSRSALCTLRATKARSSTTAAGCQRATSRRHSAWSRARRTASGSASGRTSLPLLM